MANEITPTQAAALIPANWRPRFISRFYEKNYVLPYFLNVTEDFKGGKGNIAHIAVESSDLTVNDVGSDGSLTVQQPSLTDVSVTVASNKEVTVEFTGITREQAYDKWENEFPISAGNALRQKMEADLLAQYSNATVAAQGDGTGNAGEDELLGAIQGMISAKLPIMKSPEDFVFALPDNQFAPIKKLNILDYNRTGEAGEGWASEIEVPNLWKVPVVFSTQVASSAGIRYGLLAHKTALAWAAQKNVEPRMTDRLAAAKDSWLFTVGALYGVQTVVAGRMGQIKTKA